MTVGAVVRETLGPFFPHAGRAYRRLFEDVRKVAAVVPNASEGGLMLDVGSGDGALLNDVLDRQPTLRVAALDLVAEVGHWVRSDLRDRVEVYPSTPVRTYIDSGGAAPDMALIADVLHHVPTDERRQLLQDVLDSFRDKPPVLVIKDVVPFGIRSRLGFWADRNISGDRNVVPISPVAVADLILSIHPRLRVESTPLIDMDPPNYCLVFRADS